VPTFLVTSKMNPALRARVERSLGGKNRSRGYAPGFVAALRFGTLAALAGTVVLLLLGHAAGERELAKEKQELLSTVERHSADLTREDWETLPRAEHWLRRVSSKYDGDVFAPEFGVEARASWLTRSTLYARGELKNLVGSHDLSRFLAGSARDGFVECLFEAPKKTDERGLIDHLNAARKGGFAQSDSVQWLSAAFAGMPLLSPAWANRIRDAETVEELAQFGELVKHAPLGAARRAAHAELFVLVVDEPKDGTGPVELDGTQRHFARVQLIDLRKNQELARLRLLIDPTWLSEKERQRRARDLAGCRLAVDVREALFPAPTPSRTPPIPRPLGAPTSDAAAPSAAVSSAASSSAPSSQ
jgi:hypothetical protein